MKCPKCMLENREGVKFCEECGSEFEFECPGCKAHIPIGKKFCGECGYNLIPAVEISGGKSETGSPLSRPSTKKSSSDVSPIEGERKHVTVLFSDLSAYTAMSEMLDPEEVTEITGKIFDEISKIVTNYDGFIEKYAGDAVMALFGATQSHEDDPIRAIRAAIEIHDRVKSLSPQYEEKIGQPFFMHTGINTGLVVTGQVDLEKGVRWNYATQRFHLARALLQMVGRIESKNLALNLKKINNVVKNSPSVAEKAETYLNEAIEVAKEIGAKNMLALAYFDLSVLQKTKKRTDLAREYISEAIKLFEECEADGFLNEAKDTAEIYLKQGKNALKSL